MEEKKKVILIYFMQTNEPKIVRLSPLQALVIEFIHENLFRGCCLSHWRFIFKEALMR